ncbi:hypothetical protein BHM03_00056547 [Ensete ventricosum]|nr:hypothetical protein BHM03_00056547 [Ensete ventricosum]
MAGGGGREERNRGGRRRKRRPREEKVEEGLATVKKGLPAAEAVGKRRQRGPARKRERKVRRALLEQRSRRGMADWKRLRLWLRRWWSGRGGRGLVRSAVAGEQRGLMRKRGRKVRRARLEQRSRRGMAGWKRLRLWLRKGDGGRKEEAARSGEGCGSGVW